MKVEGICFNPILWTTPNKDSYEVEISCGSENTCQPQRVKVDGFNLPTETIHERALAQCSLSCDICKAKDRKV